MTVLHSNSVIFGAGWLSTQAGGRSTSLVVAISYNNARVLPSLDSMYFRLLSKVESTQEITFLVVSSMVMDSLTSFLLGL